MNLRISELPAPARWGLLGALAGLTLLSLSLGMSARREWLAFPPPMDRPLPKSLTSFELSAALADEARVASDCGYIECLQYIAGPYASDGFWRDLLPLYSGVEWLDPGFSHAVREGISALGWFYRRPEEAERLARVAMVDDRGEPAYGAFIVALAYQKHLDAAGVLRALEPEIRRPDAPEILLRMAGNLILKQGDWAKTLAYWTWLADKATDPVTQVMAERTLAEARRHLGTPAPGPDPNHSQRN